MSGQKINNYFRRYKKLNERTWHQEILGGTLQNIGSHASGYLEAGFDLDGWHEWFELACPDIFRQHESIGEVINSAWDVEEETAIRIFKKYCREYEATSKWAIDTYVKHMKIAA
jgi:hypothetical protein